MNVEVTVVDVIDDVIGTKHQQRRTALDKNEIVT